VEPTNRDYGAALAEAERMLDGVDAALARLDNGTYAACELCGNAIGDERLAATPLVLTCERHLDVPAT
jgi:RNA polymerase-binding transcription factor DksA